MSRYIKVEDAIEAAINGCASWDGGYFPSMDDPVKEEFDAVADKCIELVRCGECKHFIEPDEEPQNGGKKYVWCKYWRVWKPEDGFCDVGRPKGENA